MSDRPTPEQIAGLDFDGQGIPDGFEMIVGHRLQLLASLRVNGYVIVHPDDYPRAEYGNVMNTTQIGFAAGVNVCLDRIFGGEQETP